MTPRAASGGRAVCRIGCSGWQYRHWRGAFYPADLPQSRWLEYYAERFDTVEVNNSFYRLPAEGLFASWRDRAPRGFVFGVKASRYLTHMKKLKDPAAPLDLLFTRVNELRRKRGPVLYQLPRQLRKNLDRLRGFLDALPRPAHIRQAIEFRHASWYDDEVLRMLEEHGVAMCLHDMAGSTSPRVSLAGFLYVRFHGEHAKYSGAYSTRTLRNWARWIVRRGEPAFVYFNNDTGGHAPRDAVRLRAMIENL